MRVSPAEVTIAEVKAANNGLRRAIASDYIGLSAEQLDRDIMGLLDGTSLSGTGTTLTYEDIRKALMKMGAPNA